MLVWEVKWPDGSTSYVNAENIQQAMFNAFSTKGFNFWQATSIKVA